MASPITCDSCPQTRRVLYGCEIFGMSVPTARVHRGGQPKTASMKDTGLHALRTEVSHPSTRCFLEPGIRRDRIDACELGKPSGRNSAGRKLPQQLLPARARDTRPRSVIHSPRRPLKLEMSDRGAWRTTHRRIKRRPLVFQNWRLHFSKFPPHNWRVILSPLFHTGMI